MTTSHCDNFVNVDDLGHFDILAIAAADSNGVQ